MKYTSTGNTLVQIDGELFRHYMGTIDQQSRRIAELEAEVEKATKLTKGFRQVGIAWETWNEKDTFVVRYWPINKPIKVQTALEAEEGEG